MSTITDTTSKNEDTRCCYLQMTVNPILCLRTLIEESGSASHEEFLTMIALACRMANQMFLGFMFPGSVLVTKAAVAPFRLWPMDIDLFGHMNNASYVRVAELSRWWVFELS